jgi:hypothetical protein
MAPGREPGHDDDIADDGGGDDRPDAEDLGEAGPGCLDPGGQPRAGLAAAGIEVADVGQQLGGDLAARLGHRPRWADLAQQPSGLACGDLVCYSAGNQVTQQRVQPADGLVAGPGQITVPFGPQLQHPGMAVRGHLLPGRRPQRRHRHRPGVVGVVLAGVPCVQQPHPGGQLGLHIQHALTGGDQLLGQQAAQPPGAFHRPRPLRPGPRPGDQLPRLVRAGPDPQRAQRLLSPAHRHRGVRALMRVDPDHHCHHYTPHRHQATGQTVAGMPYTGPALGARPSFEPRHGKVRRGGRIDLKPGTRGPAGGSGASPVGPSGRNGNRSAQSGGLYKAGRRAFSRACFITQRDVVHRCSPRRLSSGVKGLVSRSPSDGDSRRCCGRTPGRRWPDPAWPGTCPLRSVSAPG